MHHIALCTPFIALVNSGHLLHMQVDHAEPETEIQVEQVRWVFRGSQASSGEDTNLTLDQGKTRCIPPKSLSFIFETLFIILFDCALSIIHVSCLIESNLIYRICFTDGLDMFDSLRLDNLS
jgi:hypothetical protein